MTDKSKVTRAQIEALRKAACWFRGFGSYSYVRASTVRALERKGLVTVTGGRYQATDAGRLILDAESGDFAGRMTLDHALFDFRHRLESVPAILRSQGREAVRHYMRAETAAVYAAFDATGLPAAEAIERSRSAGSILEYLLGLRDVLETVAA